MHKKLAKTTGFSLIEVLVAVVLLAFSMGAVMTSIGSKSFQLVQMRDRFHASRVAMHVAGMYYLNNQWPDVGSKVNPIDVGEATWEWKAEVTATSDKKLRRVTITVYPDGVFESPLGKHLLFVSNPSAI